MAVNFSHIASSVLITDSEVFDKNEKRRNSRKHDLTNKDVSFGNSQSVSSRRARKRKFPSNSDGSFSLEENKIMSVSQIGDGKIIIRRVPGPEKEKRNEEMACQEKKNIEVKKRKVLTDEIKTVRQCSEERRRKETTCQYKKNKEKTKNEEKKKKLLTDGIKYVYQYSEERKTCQDKKKNEEMNNKGKRKKLATGKIKNDNQCSEEKRTTCQEKKNNKEMKNQEKNKQNVADEIKNVRSEERKRKETTCQDKKKNEKMMNDEKRKKPVADKIKSFEERRGKETICQDKKKNEKMKNDEKRKKPVADEIKSSEERRRKETIFPYKKRSPEMKNNEKKKNKETNNEEKKKKIVTDKIQSAPLNFKEKNKKESTFLEKKISEDQKKKIVTSKEIKKVTLNVEENQKTEATCQEKKSIEDKQKKPLKKEKIKSGTLPSEEKRKKKVPCQEKSISEDKMKKNIVSEKIKSIRSSSEKKQTACPEKRKNTQTNSDEKKSTVKSEEVKSSRINSEEKLKRETTYQEKKKQKEYVISDKIKSGREHSEEKRKKVLIGQEKKNSSERNKKLIKTNEMLSVEKNSKSHKNCNTKEHSMSAHDPFLLSKSTTYEELNNEQLKPLNFDSDIIDKQPIQIALHFNSDFDHDELKPDKAMYNSNFEAEEFRPNDNLNFDHGLSQPSALNYISNFDHEQPKVNDFIDDLHYNQGMISERELEDAIRSILTPLDTDSSDCFDNNQAEGYIAVQTIDLANPTFENELFSEQNVVCENAINGDSEVCQSYHHLHEETTTEISATNHEDFPGPDDSFGEELDLGIGDDEQSMLSLECEAKNLLEMNLDTCSGDEDIGTNSNEERYSDESVAKQNLTKSLEITHLQQTHQKEEKESIDEIKNVLNMIFDTFSGKEELGINSNMLTPEHEEKLFSKICAELCEYVEKQNSPESSEKSPVLNMFYDACSGEEELGIDSNVLTPEPCLISEFCMELCENVEKQNLPESSEKSPVLNMFYDAYSGEEELGINSNVLTPEPCLISEFCTDLCENVAKLNSSKGSENFPLQQTYQNEEKDEIKNLLDLIFDTDSGKEELGINSNLSTPELRLISEFCSQMCESVAKQNSAERSEKSALEQTHRIKEEKESIDEIKNVLDMTLSTCSGDEDIGTNSNELTSEHQSLIQVLCMELCDSADKQNSSESSQKSTLEQTHQKVEEETIEEIENVLDMTLGTCSGEDDIGKNSNVLSSELRLISECCMELSKSAVKQNSLKRSEKDNEEGMGQILGSENADIEHVCKEQVSEKSSKSLTSKQHHKKQVRNKHETEIDVQASGKLPEQSFCQNQEFGNEIRNLSAKTEKKSSKIRLQNKLSNKALVKKSRENNLCNVNTPTMASSKNKLSHGTFPKMTEKNFSKKKPCKILNKTEAKKRKCSKKTSVKKRVEILEVLKKANRNFKSFQKKTNMKLSDGLTKPSRLNLPLSELFSQDNDTKHKLCVNKNLNNNDSSKNKDEESAQNFKSFCSNHEDENENSYTFWCSRLLESSKKDENCDVPALQVIFSKGDKVTSEDEGSVLSADSSDFLAGEEEWETSSSEAAVDIREQVDKLKIILGDRVRKYFRVLSCYLFGYLSREELEEELLKFLTKAEEMAHMNLFRVFLLKYSKFIQSRTDKTEHRFNEPITEWYPEDFRDWGVETPPENDHKVSAKFSDISDAEDIEINPTAESAQVESKDIQDFATAFYSYDFHQPFSILSDQTPVNVVKADRNELNETHCQRNTPHLFAPNEFQLQTNADLDPSNMGGNFNLESVFSDPDRNPNVPITHPFELDSDYAKELLKANHKEFSTANSLQLQQVQVSALPDNQTAITFISQESNYAMHAYSLDVGNDVNATMTEENATNCQPNVPMELNNESNIVSNPSEDSCHTSCAISESDASFNYDVPPKQLDETLNHEYFSPSTLENNSFQPSHLSDNCSTAFNHLSITHAKFPSSEDINNTFDNSHLQVFSNSKRGTSSGNVSDHDVPKVVADSSDPHVISPCDPYEGKLPNNVEETSNSNDCCLQNQFSTVSGSCNELNNSDFSQTNEQKEGDINSSCVVNPEIQNNETESNSMCDNNSSEEKDYYFVNIGVPDAGFILFNIFNEEFHAKGIDVESIRPELDSINEETELFIDDVLLEYVLNNREELEKEYRSKNPNADVDEDFFTDMTFEYLTKYCYDVPKQELLQMGTKFIFDLVHKLIVNL